MTREDAIALATKRAQSEGLENRGVPWAKYYPLDHLEGAMQSRGTFWVVRFDGDGDSNMHPEPGFAVFVYEKDGRTEIPTVM